MNVIIAVLLCFIVHEGGHWLAALCFGRRLLRFRFQFGRFYAPRLVWDMPQMEKWKQRVVALAGFCTEYAVAGVLLVCGWPQMAAFALLHLAAYPFYCGGASDFKWL